MLVNGSETGEKVAERGRSGASTAGGLSGRSSADEGRAIQRWLPEVVKRIVEGFEPLRVILFGSVARGEANYHSDVDLLVVFEEVGKNDRHSVAVQIRRALADLPISKDIVVTDLDEVSRRGKVVGTVLHEALQEGKSLYDRP